MKTEASAGNFPNSVWGQGERAREEQRGSGGGGWRREEGSESEDNEGAGNARLRQTALHPLPQPLGARLPSPQPDPLHLF